MLRAIFNNTSTIFAPRWKTSALSRIRFYYGGPGEEDRTFVRALNQEDGAALMVDSFSQVGFRLNNGMAVFGPIAIFPKTVLSWLVDSCNDINEDSLSLFYLLDPKIDILIIGVGDSRDKINPRIVQFMRQKGINVEVLPTESACTTFNFLNDEKRYVAAALIPPSDLRATGDDMIKTQIDQKRLFRESLDDEKND